MRLTVLGPASGNRRHSLCLALLPLLASLACASSAGPPPQIEPLESFLIGTGDELSFRILPDPPIDGTGLVRPDGTISVELIGQVRATGRTIPEVEAEIEKRMSQYRQGPRATLWISALASTSLDVTGEVRRPGRYAMTQEMRLSDAIALAGGATQLAATSRVRLIRSTEGGSVMYEADLDEIRAGNLTDDVLLRQGDILFVPPAYTVVFGYGIRRWLYPIESLLGVVTGGLGFLATSSL